MAPSVSMIDSALFNGIPKRYHSSFENSIMSQGGMSLYRCPITESNILQLGNALIPAKEVKGQANALIYAITTPLNKLDLGMKRFYVAGDYGRKTAASTFEDLVLVTYMNHEDYEKHFREGKKSTLIEMTYKSLKDYLREFKKNGPSSLDSSAATVAIDELSIVVTWCDMKVRLIYAPWLSKDGFQQVNQALGFICFKNVTSGSENQLDWSTCLDEVACKFTAALPEDLRCYIRMMRHWAMVTGCPMSPCAIDALATKVVMTFKSTYLPDPATIFKSFFQCLADPATMKEFNAFNYQMIRNKYISNEMNQFNNSIEVDFNSMPRRKDTTSPMFLGGLFDQSVNVLETATKQDSVTLAEIGKEMIKRLNKDNATIHDMFEPLNTISYAKGVASLNSQYTRTRPLATRVALQLFKVCFWLVALIGTMAAFSIWYTMQSDGTLDQEAFAISAHYMQAGYIKISDKFRESLPIIMESNVYSRFEDVVWSTSEFIFDFPEIWENKVPSYIQLSAASACMGLNNYIQTVQAHAWTFYQDRLSEVFTRFID